MRSRHGKLYLKYTHSRARKRKGERDSNKKFMYSTSSFSLLCFCEKSRAYQRFNDHHKFMDFVRNRAHSKCFLMTDCCSEDFLFSKNSFRVLFLLEDRVFIFWRANLYRFSSTLFFCIFFRKRTFPVSSRRGEKYRVIFSAVDED
jgi:hypothetical protein